MLYMRVGELIALPCESMRSTPTSVVELKAAILDMGWSPDSVIEIMDGEVTIGNRRVRALTQLFREDKISGDLQIPVRIYRTMLRPVLVNVETDEILLDGFKHATRQ